jgi:hypothetical protein
MMKRNMGCELAARSYQSQRREMLLMVLTHNLAIFLLFNWGFLQSMPVPICLSVFVSPCFVVGGNGGFREYPQPTVLSNQLFWVATGTTHQRHHLAPPRNTACSMHGAGKPILVTRPAKEVFLR